MVVLCPGMPERFFWTRKQAGIGFFSPPHPPPKNRKRRKPPAADPRKLDLNLPLPEGDLRVPFPVGGNCLDAREQFTGIILRWCRQPRQDHLYRLKICLSALKEKSQSLRQGSSANWDKAICCLSRAPRHGIKFIFSPSKSKSGIK